MAFQITHPIKKEFVFIYLSCFSGTGETPSSSPGSLILWLHDGGPDSSVTTESFRQLIWESSNTLERLFNLKFLSHILLLHTIQYTNDRKVHTAYWTFLVEPWKGNKFIYMLCHLKGWHGICGERGPSTIWSNLTCDGGSCCTHLIHWSSTVYLRSPDSTQVSDF